jgi:hypothetical protein
LRHCGAYVADALKKRIGDREVQCAVRELDQYDRRISTCEVAAEDLSSWLVSEGLALANRPSPTGSFRTRRSPGRRAVVLSRLPLRRRGITGTIAGGLLCRRHPKDARSRATSIATANGSTTRRGKSQWY